MFNLPTQVDRSRVRARSKMTLSRPLAKEACPTAGGILRCKGVPIMVQYIATPEMIQNPTCSVMQKLQKTDPCQNHF